MFNTLMHKRDKKIYLVQYIFNAITVYSLIFQESVKDTPIFFVAYIIYIKL